jgi:hypothetical protein
MQLFLEHPSRSLLNREAVVLIFAVAGSSHTIRLAISRQQWIDSEMLKYCLTHQVLRIFLGGSYIAGGVAINHRENL